MAESERGTTKPVAGTVFYVLLALADRARYGLDIAKEVARRTDGNVALGPGTLYNAVKKMLSDGLIQETRAADIDASGADDPRRRYYQITGRGRRLLAEEAGRLELLVSAARDKKILPSS